MIKYTVSSSLTPNTRVAGVAGVSGESRKVCRQKGDIIRHYYIRNTVMGAGTGPGACSSNISSLGNVHNGNVGSNISCNPVLTSLQSQSKLLKMLATKTAGLFSISKIIITRVIIFLIVFSSLLTTNLVGGVSSIKFRNNAHSNGEKCEHTNDNKTMTGVKCDFEEHCPWTWNIPKREETGFRNMTAAQVITKMHKLGEWAFRGPIMDSENKTDGHFLLLAFENETKNQAHYRLTSPWFVDSHASCNLQANVHMHNMDLVALRMLINTRNHSSYVPMSVLGNKRNSWERLKQMVGEISQAFQITLEVDNHSGIPSHFAIDDIRMVDCFPSEKPCNKTCSDKQFQCSDGNCIDRNQICDLNKDCVYGEDEDQNCEKTPDNTTCTFEKDWCGWSPQNVYTIAWERTNKPYQPDKTGPRFDHTFGNSSGHFLMVNMKVKNSSFHQAVLKSPIYAVPPAYNHNRSSPYFQTCQFRFFYHMYGAHVETLDVEFVYQLRRNKEIKRIRMCTQNGNQGNMWYRLSCKLPNLQSLQGIKKYYLQITAMRGLRGELADIAIDDISLSPECFGIGVPTSETIGYNYHELLNSPDEHPGNVTAAYRLTTCNNTGNNGPLASQCDVAYNGTLASNSVSMDSSRKGIQIWTVPETKSYTLIAKGARGGQGAITSVNAMQSYGSVVRVTMFLRKGERIYVLVGQEGISACDETTGSAPEKDAACRRPSILPRTRALSSVNLLKKAIRQATQDPPKGRPLDDKFSVLKQINQLTGGGGGGGGATFVYKMNGNTITPILVGAGGGGLGYNASLTSPNGRGLDVSLQPRSGSTIGWWTGGGGGWEGGIVKNNNSVEPNVTLRQASSRMAEVVQNQSIMLISAGLSLVDGGGVGGKPCPIASVWGTFGGFGGGGGGCVAGGGGGGYVGGNAQVSMSANGEGGLSFIGKGGMYPAVDAGVHSGPGEFIAYPSFVGCGCQHFCVLLDEFGPHSGCVCQENWILSEDGITCLERYEIPVIAIIILCVIIFCVVGIVCFCLYNRYQRQKASMLRRKVMGGPELQLSRLRAQAGPGGVLTEYNPNYEFGGETYTLTDLKEIPRENLRLVKALGQGAFGEVYQGFYRHRDGDAVEMPVAVKTLPELSSNQAEMDFLMEALIMSKFNHPNIVHFIGVCFDKHPRFIILELLAGGDLKTFLRESRPKPDKGSPLSMKDLLLCAMDVAKGSKYLEDNHFIHRDIAARNCLLTTKGPGRVVKIADFGMARDIYRADYYKKGGKAMLPVKWMPPEAFLDGIFTSKTDVWSYGVLLWEIFSLGYMPYPGRGNQDVMQLVTNGGRLEPPSNCPTPVYGIMTQCWHPIPEERPNFATIMERLGYCIQDPEVVNAPLPIFQRPPSSERDTTLMRPSNSDDSSCLRIIHGHYPRNAPPSSFNHNEPLSPNSSTADYLVPLTPLSNPTTPPPPTDPSIASPCSDIPESHSTETILDEDEENEAALEEASRLRAPHPNYTVSSSSSSKMAGAGAGSSNGIDNGITLTPSSLGKGAANSKRSATSITPTPKSYTTDITSKKKTVDEEIRC